MKKMLCIKDETFVDVCYRKKVLILFLSILLFISGCQLENNNQSNTNNFTADFFYHYIEGSGDKNYIMLDVCIYNDGIDDLDKVELIYDKNINYDELSDEEYNMQYAQDYFDSRISYEKESKPFYYIYETHLNEDLVNKTLPREITLKYNNEEIIITVNALIEIK